ncbi:MAG: hypothetical protein ACHQ1H_04550, partial [Nitrososphaerales archaeon]
PLLRFSSWPETLVDGIGYHELGVQIHLENKSPGEVAEINQKLRDGDPSIWVYYHGGRNLEINMLYLADGDEQIIAETIKVLV